MSRPLDLILNDIETFQPSDGSWLGLDDLLFELWDVGVPVNALPLLFRVFERFPNDDGAGVLWTIVHGIEALPHPYEEPLRASLARCTSLMGKVMLKRLENSRLA